MVRVILTYRACGRAHARAYMCAHCYFVENTPDHPDHIEQPTGITGGYPVRVNGVNPGPTPDHPDRPWLRLLGGVGWTGGEGAGAMNYFNQLLDGIGESGGIDIQRGLLGSDAREVLLWTMKSAGDFVCFDMGELESLEGFRVVNALSALPYDRCCFTTEFIHDDRKVVKLVLVHQVPDKPLTQTALYEKSYGRWMLKGASQAPFIRFGEDHPGYAYGLAGHKAVQEEENNLVIAIKCFLSAINCTNVRRIRHDPSAKLQKKRRKHGKLPLFSYYTLELNGRNEPALSLGGRHASPRVHLRRGHPREYAPGKWTWVQPCVVGNKGNGMVHKDYKPGKHLYDDCHR